MDEGTNALYYFLHNPTIPFYVFFQEKVKCVYIESLTHDVPSSFMRNSPKLEATHMSISGELTNMW